MGKVSNSFRIIKASWQVFKKDKEMIFFPFLSGFILFLLFASNIAYINQVNGFDKLNKLIENHDIGIYLYLFLIIYLTVFIGMFLNSALMACAKIRLEGDNPNVIDGILIASTHTINIALWALISLTIGVFLSLIEELFNEKIAKLFSNILGITWGITSFFVLPIIIFEKKGPFEALKESSFLAKNTWGEEIVGNISIRLIFFILYLPALLLIIPILHYNDKLITIILISFGLLYIAIIKAIDIVIEGIFQTALYQFVQNNILTEDFERTLLMSIVKKY